MADAGDNDAQAGWWPRLRSWWRQRGRPWWQTWRWPVIGALAFVLGCAGFRRHFAARGEGATLPDVVCLSLQLFVMESGAVREAPWEL